MGWDRIKILEAAGSGNSESVKPNLLKGKSEKISPKGEKIKPTASVWSAGVVPERRKSASPKVWGTGRNYRSRVPSSTKGNRRMEATGYTKNCTGGGSLYAPPSGQRGSSWAVREDQIDYIAERIKGDLQNPSACLVGEKGEIKRRTVAQEAARPAC